MWDHVEGMEVRRYHEGGHNRIAYFADGERVSEGIFKRRYVAQIEAENELLHAKLAKIFDIL